MAKRLHEAVLVEAAHVIEDALGGYMKLEQGCSLVRCNRWSEYMVYKNYIKKK